MALLREGLLTVCDHVHGGLFLSSHPLLLAPPGCHSLLHQPRPAPLQRIAQPLKIEGPAFVVYLCPKACTLSPRVARNTRNQHLAKG